MPPTSHVLMETLSVQMKFVTASRIVLTHRTKGESFADQSFVKRINLNAITARVSAEKSCAISEATVSTDRMSSTAVKQWTVASK